MRSVEKCLFLQRSARLDRTRRRRRNVTYFDSHHYRCNAGCVPPTSRGSQDKDGQYRLTCFFSSPTVRLRSRATLLYPVRSTRGCCRRRRGAHRAGRCRDQRVQLLPVRTQLPRQAPRRTRRRRDSRQSRGPLERPESRRGRKVCRQSCPRARPRQRPRSEFSEGRRLR